MAYVPRWRAGAEMQNVNETVELGSAAYGNSSTITISSTKAFTGTFSFRGSGVGYPRGYAGNLNQLRSGFRINHNGLDGATSTYKGIVALITCSGITDIYVIWDAATNNLELWVNGILQTSIPATTGGFPTINAWKYIGVTYKAHASAGFFSFYLDGVKVLTFTGNTGTNATGVYFFGKKSGAGWKDFIYFDDFYVDECTAGEADLPPPSPQIPLLLPSGAGTSVQWGVTGAASNHLAVDEATAPNDNTDYVSAASANLKDYYAVADYTIGGGMGIARVTPVAWAMRSDVGVDSRIALGAKVSASEVIGASQAPGSAYGYVQGESQSTKPGGGNWDQSSINSLEFVLKSEGTF